MSFLIINSNIFAQTSASGSRFWLGFIENISLLFNGDPAFGIVVSAEQDVTGIISVPQTGLQIPFSLAAGETQEIFLPDAVWYTQGTEIIDNKGILIETSDDITLQVYHYRIYFAESARILPESMLADDYTVLAGEDFNASSPSSLVIVATEDNTTVEITPSTLTQGLHPGGITFSVVLNQGQNYQIHAAADLSGTTIKALNNKKIAVFTGARQADVWCQGDDSHLWEQLPPKSMWRTHYAIVPYQNQGGDPIKIMAALDGTEIRKNCEDWLLLDAGQYTEVLMEDIAYIEANQAILIAQFNKSQNCNTSNEGGPSFSFPNPLLFQQYQASFIVPAAQDLPSVFDTQRLTIICKNEDIANVLLDAEAVAGFIPFGPAQTFACAQIELNPGLHELSSTTPFWTHFHGLGQYDAYSHAGGFTEEIPLEWPITIHVSGSPTQEQLCLDDILNFSINSNLELQYWDWDFGDGSVSILQNPAHTYSTEGNYLVQFTGTDANNCEFSQSMMLQIEDCDSGMNDVNAASDFYIFDNMLYSGLSVKIREILVFDSAGRLLSHDFNPAMPATLPASGFLIRIKDENNRAYTLKTARLKRE